MAVAAALITARVLLKLYVTIRYQSRIYPFSKRQILDSSKLKEFANDNFRLMKMAESSPKWLKTLWEKEKLLVMYTSNFFFSYSVFKKTCTADMLKKGLTVRKTKNLIWLRVFKLF